MGGWSEGENSKSAWLRCGRQALNSKSQNAERQWSITRSDSVAKLPKRAERAGLNVSDSEPNGLQMPLSKSNSQFTIQNSQFGENGARD